MIQRPIKNLTPAEIQKRIDDILPVLQKAATGDFSNMIPIPDDEDSLTELCVALNLMIDDLRETREGLEKEVSVRTRELRESEERYRVLYEESRDAIMTLAPPTWQFTAGNPAALRLFGISDEKQFISLGPWDVSPEQQPDGSSSGEEAKKRIEQAMKNGSNYFEWTHRKYKGDTFPATVLLTRIEFKGQQLLQATVRDITVRKQAEENVRKKVIELEQLNKLMIGREMKMIELKNENARLITQLKECQAK